MRSPDRPVFSMLRNALDLDYALDHISLDRGFDSARISALVKADVTDVADFFDLLTDRAVKGKKTIIADATIDISTRDTMRVRPAEHWFPSTNRVRGICGRSGDREDQRYPVHPKHPVPPAITFLPRHARSRAVIPIRVSPAIAGTCGTAHRARPLLICGGAVKHPRGAPATERL